MTLVRSSATTVPSTLKIETPNVRPTTAPHLNNALEFPQCTKPSVSAPTMVISVSNKISPPTSTHLTFLQCNLFRCYRSTHEYKQYLCDNDFDVGLVTEPYIGPTNNMSPVAGYQLYQFPGNTGTKASILIKNGLGAPLGMAQYSSSNLSVVQLSVSGRRFFIISVYVEPEVDVDNTLDKLEAFLKLHVDAYHIIGGDFNGHHQLWGCDKRNPRGKDMDRFILANNLHLSNIGNVPTFETVTHGRPRTSIVDLTLISDNLSDKVYDWRVDPDACQSSDHNAIRFNFILNKSTITKNKTKTTYRYSTKFANWDNFADTLTNNPDLKKLAKTEMSTMSHTQIDKFVDDLTAAIQQCCDKSLPRKPSPKDLRPWWNDVLEAQKKELIRYHHTIQDLKRHKKPIDNILQEREALKKQYADAISKASSDNFREFCSWQGKEDVWSVTNRLMKSGPLPQPPTTLRLECGRRTGSSQETAAELLKKFYPDDEDADTADQQLIREQSKSIPDTADEPPFTMDEVMQCLKSMNPNRAPGVDHLTSDICSAFAKCYPQLLTDLMNQCLNVSHFPTSWKNAFVKVLPKPNKDDYSDVGSYRPIGLINVLGKLLEKLITQRLTFHQQVNDYHCERQFGFKAQTSTLKALESALGVVKAAREKRHLVIAISLDIKAAFDNAWWPALLQRLHNIKCPRNLYKIIQNYLQERKVLLHFADAASSKIMTRGCVQGSVCGPAFWNLILDELLQMTLPDGCHLQAFADDVLLIVESRDVTTLQHAANLALDNISKWGRKVKLTFGPSKTQLISFTHKANKAKIVMDNTLKYVNSFKLLGVIIDKNLKFNEHAEHIVTKARKLYNKLCKFIRPTWGINSDNVATLYHYVIEPIITYAAGIWGSATKFKVVRDKLRSLQRGFALKIIRAFRTVSANAAIALAGLTPLHLKVKEIATIERTRLTGLTEYLPSDVTIEKPAKIKDLLHPSLRKSIDYSTATNQDDINNILTSDPDTIQIYTDGSKLEDNSVGAAFVVTHPKPQKPLIIKKYKLDKSCTVFQAELLAINKACAWILKNAPTSKIIIFSDSQSSLEEIKNMNSTNQFVVAIHRIISKRPISFCWVKSHVGIAGNERADTAAKSAALSHQAVTYTNFPISFVKYAVKKQHREKANCDYIQHATGAQTRVWCPNLDSINELRSCIKMGFATTQVLTGHGYHLEYLHRFKITQTDKCPCDPSTIQSIKHLLEDCPRFGAARHNHIQMCMTNNTDPFNLKSILKSTGTINSFVDLIEYIVKNLKHYNNM